MKIFVGIDIAKLNLFAAAISSDGEILIEPFKFTNDADGFHLLVSKLESFDKDSSIIGLESTAHYGHNLVRYLVAEFYQVCVLNPIKTCQMRKNNVRKTKTDKVDTFKSGLHQHAVYALLKEAPSPKEIVSMHMTHPGKSAQSELTRALYQRAGQRIKSSRTEVCRCKRQRYIYSDNSDNPTNRVTG